MKEALNKVLENKGAAGIDGMTVDNLPAYLKENWKRIRTELLEGRYAPRAVRRIEIPKTAGGMRQLGIPTVVPKYYGWGLRCPGLLTTFRSRGMRDKNGGTYLGFGPAISDSAAKEVRRTIRGWHLHRRTFTSLDELARTINATVRGWINYYGRFYKSRLYRTLAGINYFLVKWAMRKYKKRSCQPERTREWLRAIAERNPTMFAHWKFGIIPGICCR